MFNRLMMTIRSNLNEMIDGAEDPEKMLNQVIIDMQMQLIHAKKQVALVIADENARKPLRRSGLLTRDSRVKERKKYGLKRARKAPQYTKR